MNFFKNPTSVLSRLSVSYLMVVLTGTILTGLIANFMLERSHDSQIVNYNTAVVNTLRDYVYKDIISGTDRVYIKIASENDSDDFFLASFEEDDLSYRSIKRIINYMNEVAISENEWLDGMYVYFSRPGVLAGTDGLIYKRSAHTANMPAWLNTVLEAEGDFLYVPTMPYMGTYMYEDENQCMLAKKYPLIYSGNESMGYVVFKINADVIAKILSQAESAGGEEYRTIIDRNGNVIASTKKEKYPALFEGWEKFFEKNPEPDGHTEIVQSGVKCVVTYSTIEPYGWRLMSVCPKSVFYRTSKHMQMGMIFVCFLTVMLALAVSEHYKRKIYSPIKNIVDRVGGMRDGEKDEYGAIAAAINDMSYKISDLQAMVDVARLASKRELVMSLCMDKSIGQEVKKLIDVCNFDTQKKAYISVIFRLDKDITENLTAETVSELIKNCIYTIESMTDENTCYIAGGYSGNKIIAVAGFEHANENVISSGISKINDMIYTAYYLSLVSVVGMPVRRYEDINLSFESAENAERYSMFKKPGSLIYASDVLKLDNSQLMMDERIMETFKKNVFAFDTQAIKDDINNIIRELSGRGYSASYCNSKLLEVVNIISSYIKSNGINSYDIMDGDLITIFNEMDNIYEYEEWIYAIVEKIAERLNTRNATNNSSIIEKVKQYVEGNLSDDLSLTTVSDRVYISSQYLCKIFKEETNMNFIDYVTQVRMEKAKELLLETNMNIESVAESVGYKTPHYFTKKFKERYGVTPKSFRMNQ